MPSEESKSIRKTIRKETGACSASLSEQRKAWLDYAETQTTHRDVALREDVIAGVPCLWLTRKHTPKASTILYVHGGGLVDGSIATHREFVSRLVALTGHQAVMLDYRLVPEHSFPAALDDVVRVVEALIASGRVEASRLSLGGDSSGGGLVLSAMTRLRKEGKRLPACGFALSGVFDMTLSGESMARCNEIDPCLSYEALKAWTRHFGDYDLRDAGISPLFGDLEGLPPILLQVGSDEVWLDDSVRMRARIKAAGGCVELKIWEAMWHVWPMYSDLLEAAQAIEVIGDFVDKATVQVVNKSIATPASASS